MQISLSKLDKERFGIETAKATNISEIDLPDIIDFCKRYKVKFLIARCRTNELPAAQKMESLGFLLMDTLVYYVRNLQSPPIPADKGVAVIRSIHPGEEEKVKKIAAESFHGYFGHYHADNKLEKIRCDEVYTSWAYSSCLFKDVADKVLIAEVGEEVVGFLTLKLEAKTGEGVLNAVAPNYQRRGIYSSLMIHAMKWLLANNVGEMIISTQINNIVAQKVWIRLGFEPSYSIYTFHKWFDW